jgi:hypothetical protein
MGVVPVVTVMGKAGVMRSGYIDQLNRVNGKAGVMRWGIDRAYNSAPKHVMRGNAVLKSDEYETLALHVLVNT